MYYISNNIKCVGKMLNSSRKKGSVEQFVTYLNLQGVYYKTI